MDVTSYTDGVLVTRRELTADDFTVISHLRKTLRDKESFSVSQKRSPILSHAPPKAEISLLAGVDVRVANVDGIVLVGVQVGSESFVKRHGLEVVRKKRSGKIRSLAFSYPGMPDKQAAMLIATREATYKATSYRRRLYTRLFRAACKWVYHECLWILERVLKLASSTIQEFFNIYMYIYIYVYIYIPGIYIYMHCTSTDL